MRVAPQTVSTCRVGFGKPATKQLISRTAIQTAKRDPEHITPKIVKTEGPVWPPGLEPPRIIDEGFARSQQDLINHVVDNPLIVPGTDAQVFLLGVIHNQTLNPYLIAQVAQKVQPDIIAMEQLPGSIKAYQLGAERLGFLIEKMMNITATSLSAVFGCLSLADKLAFCRMCGKNPDDVWSSPPIKPCTPGLFMFSEVDVCEFLAAAVIARKLGVPLQGIDAINVPMEELNRIIKLTTDTEFFPQFMAGVRELTREAIVHHSLEPEVVSALSLWQEQIDARLKLQASAATTPEGQHQLYELQYIKKIVDTVKYQLLPPTAKIQLATAINVNEAEWPWWRRRNVILIDQRDEHMHRELVNVAKGPGAGEANHEYKRILAVVFDAHVPGMRKLFENSNDHPELN